MTIDDVNYLKIGDSICYKANGIRGSFEAKVVKINKTRITIRLESYDGIKCQQRVLSVLPKRLEHSYI